MRIMGQARLDGMGDATITTIGGAIMQGRQAGIVIAGKIIIPDIIYFDFTVHGMRICMASGMPQSILRRSEQALR